MAVNDAVSVIGLVVECAEKPGAVVETMVGQLDAAVGPVVDKRRDVAKTSDGKDVRLALSRRLEHRYGMAGSVLA